MHPDALLAEFGSCHDGIATRAELLALDLDRRLIDRRLRSGYLRPRYRGVYSIGHDAITERGRLRAGLLAGGTGARLSHDTLSGLVGATELKVGPIHVTRERRGRPQRGLVLHCSQLPLEDIGTFQGFPVTSPERLMLDLAETESPRVVKRAYNELHVLRLLTRRSLMLAMDRWSGRHGLAYLRELVGEDAGVTLSVLEDLFLPLVRQARLPLPRCNQKLLGFLVDAVWPAHRVVVELDGRTYHDTDPRFESDRARTNALVARGWLVLRFTYRRLKMEPYACIAELAQVLSRRELTTA